jgi:hypothetical protein
MKAAIEILEHALKLLEADEPYSRKAGRVEFADNQAKEAAEIRHVLSILSVIHGGPIWPEPSTTADETCKGVVKCVRLDCKSRDVDRCKANGCDKRIEPDREDSPPEPDNDQRFVCHAVTEGNRIQLVKRKGEAGYDEFNEVLNSIKRNGFVSWYGDVTDENGKEQSGLVITADVAEEPPQG